MRILLAVDGSESSDRARELVASMPLPDGSVVRVVAVQEPHLDVLGLSWVAVGDSPAPEETDLQTEARHLREAVERAELALNRPGITVEGFLVRGRSGSAIVDEAVTMLADLVVLGSRGHSPIATMLLGSTASEVVDHAPCPVLIARNERLGPIAFADDGSAAARTAESVLTAWPILADRPISVVSVAEVGVPVATGFTPGLYDQVMASYTQAVDEARQERREVADATAARLREAGRDAHGVVLEGDPAGELVRFAEERGTGTIVMGTRGHTGLARLILGSVARNVLLHAPCSVLIVRGRHGAAGAGSAT
jgi:nucleotide-binding universal stress UspA family protein